MKKTRGVVLEKWAMTNVSTTPGYFPGPARTRYSLKRLPGPGKYPGVAFTIYQTWPSLAEMMIKAESSFGPRGGGAYDAYWATVSF